jgi:hypothetical protein
MRRRSDNHSGRFKGLPGGWSVLYATRVLRLLFATGFSPRITIGRRSVLQGLPGWATASK